MMSGATSMDTAWRTYVAACQHDAVVVGIDGLICAANKQLSARVGLPSAEQLENTPITSLLATPGDAPPPAVEETAPRWEALRQVLDGAAGTPSEEADGVSKEHALAAREEAARKLITHHEAVVRDVTNPRPKTQVQLARVDEADAPYVDQMLREVARRLLGAPRGSERLEETLDAPDGREGPFDAGELPALGDAGAMAGDAATPRIARHTARALFFCVWNFGWLILGCIDAEFL